MRHHHRGALWTVAVLYLVAAVLTAGAEVGIASPVVLAVVALVAFGLGFARPTHTGEDRHPQLGSSDPGGSSRGTTHDLGGDADSPAGHRERDDEDDRDERRDGAA